MTSTKFAMLKLSIVCAMGLGTTAIVPAAAAADGYRAEATLATPVQAATEKDVDGVTWRCEHDKCFGKAEKRASLDSYMKECRKVSAGLGKLTRFYSRGREMHVYLQAYQRAAATIEPMTAFVTFYRGADKILDAPPVAIVDGLDPRSKAVPIRFSVPLDGLTPGRYDCQVSVLDASSQKVAFWRAPIVVVP